MTRALVRYIGTCEYACSIIIATTTTERGTGEPAMLEQGREAIEDVNGLGPTRNGQRG